MRLASGGSHGHSPRVMDAYSNNLPAAADDGSTSLHCSNLTSWHTSLRQTSPVSFSWKETGAHTTAASHVAYDIAAILLVTIGLTKSDLLPSATTQAPVPQLMEGLHLTDSQACPQVSMSSPFPTQDLQVPNSSVGTASTRPYLRMRLRRPDSWVHALAPGRKEPFVTRQ